MLCQSCLTRCLVLFNRTSGRVISRWGDATKDRRGTETSGEMNGGQEGVAGAFFRVSVSRAAKSPKELKPRPRDVAGQINPT